MHQIKVAPNYLKIFINYFSQMLNFRLFDSIELETNVSLKTQTEIPHTCTTEWR